MSENIPTEFTREIYWSPTGELKGIITSSTYVFFALALVAFGYGCWQHWKRWQIGKEEDVFSDPLERFKLFLKYVLGQYKVMRQRRMRDKDGKHSLYAGIMHGLIFYGFLALVIGTTIVALKEYEVPLLQDLYTGWRYSVVSFMCELGGVALTIGVFMGIFRRSSKKNEFSHGIDYWVMYLLLFVLCVQGFAAEAFRLAYQPNPIDIDTSFLGAALAGLFPQDMKMGARQNLYTFIWGFHMITTMAFIALIPYTRFMHIVTGSLNLVTQRKTPTVNLAPMGFKVSEEGDVEPEDPEAEYFGAQTVKDFTWKDLLAFDSCTECRRCTDICPANNIEKPLDPRKVILKLRDSMRVEAQLPQQKTGTEDSASGPREESLLFESGTIQADEIWACTNCGGCVSECPVGIDQPRAIMELRRYQAMTLGEIPPEAANAISNIQVHNNPWGVAADDRFKWADGLDLPVITEESPEVEWLYYVGCAGSYDSSNQKVARSLVRILQATGVEFAVMGKGESCTGEPLKRLGDEYSFAMQAVSNVEHLKQLKFKKVLTHCPHCYNTLKNDYKEYGGHFEVVHHTQLLTQLVKDNKLKLPTEVKKDVTFHDPCFLGRHNGEYDAPREVLESIAGLRLAEMEYSKETSSCCGMGGGNMWFESEGGKEQMVERRLKHVAETKSDTLVTGCSFCMINFKGAFQTNEDTKNLEVMDIAEAVELAMEKPGTTT